MQPADHTAQLLAVRHHTLSELADGRPYDVSLQYRSEVDGSDFQVTWTGVRFLRPWWQSPRFLAATILIGLVALFGLGLLVPRSSKVRRGAAPLLCGLGILTLWVRWGALGGRVDTHLLRGGGGLLLGLALLAVLLFPPVARVLGRAEPFRSFLTLGLRIPRTRRRLLARHVADTREALRRAADATRHEAYLKLPARFSNGGTVDDPAPPIVAWLNGVAGSGRSVVIEAPGGRGKSALLRQALAECVERAAREAEAPVPVVLPLGSLEASDGTRTPDSLQQTSDPVEQAIVRTVRSAYPDEDMAAREVRAGHFVAFIDGVSESVLRPHDLASLQRPLQVVVSARSEGGFGDVANDAVRWLRVEPLLLDPAALQRFEETYLGVEGRGRPAPLPPVPPSLREACRVGRQAEYLPVLVRLAIVAHARGVGRGPEDAPTIVDVYEGAMKDWLERTGKSPHEDTQAVYDRLLDLVVQTHWRNLRTAGASEIAYLPSDPAYVRALQAGILLRAGGGGRGLAPVRVKFFHDSVQSFLAAHGLLRKELWRALRRAAGDGRFRRGSDILRGEGTELFQMCLLTFGPPSVVTDHLVEALQAWAPQYVALSNQNIVDALPEELRATFLKEPLDQLTARRAVERGMELCRDAASTEETLRRLGSFFGALAPILWKASPSQRARDHKLTGAELKDVRDAIVRHFTRDRLKEVLRTRLERNFEALVSDGPLDDQAFQLLVLAEAQHWTSDLLQALELDDEGDDGPGPN